MYINVSFLIVFQSSLDDDLDEDITDFEDAVPEDGEFVDEDETSNSDDGYDDDDDKSNDSDDLNDDDADDMDDEGESDLDDESDDMVRILFAFFCFRLERCLNVIKSWNL